MLDYFLFGLLSVLARPQGDLGFQSPDKPNALLGDPIQIPERFSWSKSVASFTTWLDGKQALIYGVEKSFSIDRLNLEKRIHFETPSNAHLFFGFRGKSDKRRMIMLANDDLHGEAKFVLCMNENGDALWTAVKNNHRIKGFAPLFDESGVYGFAIAHLARGGNCGITGINSEGVTLWTKTKEYAVYELQSHSELPGKLLVLGGRFSIYDHGRHHLRGDRFSQEVQRNTRGLFATHGVLLPDDQGKPNCIITSSTSSREEAHTIRRSDGLKETFWEVQLPAEASGVTMIEPTNRERLIMITLRNGQLIVFDEHGKEVFASFLHSNAHFEVEGEKMIPVEFLEAGEIAPNVWALAVRTDKTYVYTVHPEVLDDKR